MIIDLDEFLITLIQWTIIIAKHWDCPSPKKSITNLPITYPMLSTPASPLSKKVGFFLIYSMVCGFRKLTLYP